MALPSTTNMRWYYDAAEASGTCTDQHAGFDLTDVNTVGQADGPETSSNARLFTEADSDQFRHAEDDIFSDMGDADFYTCGWVYFTDALAGSGQFQDLWGSWQEAGNDRCWLVSQTNDSIRFYVSADGTAQVYAEESGSVTTGVWYFVEGYHDATGNEVAISVTAKGDSLATFDTTAHSGGVYAPTGGDRARFQVSGIQDYGNHHVDARWCRCTFLDAIPTTDERTSLYNGGDGVTYSDFAPSAFDTREKRMNVARVGRPWMRARHAVGATDEQSRIESGHGYGANALSPSGGGFQVAWARGSNVVLQPGVTG